MSLKLCLSLAVVLLATAIPLVGANTVAGACVLTLSSIHPFIDVGLVVVGFVLGAQDTNVCPAGSVPVGTAGR